MIVKKLIATLYVKALRMFYIKAYKSRSYKSVLWHIYRHFIVPLNQKLRHSYSYLRIPRSYLNPGQYKRKGTQKLWDTYNQLMEYKRNCELEKARNGLRLLLTDVEAIQKDIRLSGMHSYLPVLTDAEKIQKDIILGEVKPDLTMPKNQKILSLKELAMNIHYALGEINELTQNNDEAIVCYDRCARIPSRHEWRGPSSENLAKVQNTAYRQIGRLVRRKEKPVYDVLIASVGIQSNMLPWSLMVLGTWLEKEGKKVRLMDGCSDDEDILKEAANASLIGFSVMTCQIVTSLRLSRNLKKLYPNKPIVWGGVHPTLFPMQCLSENSIDFIIREDGEDALTALSTKLEQKDFDFCNIPGLGYKNDGVPILNPVGEPCDFKSVGRWKFELLDMRKYMNYTAMLEDFKYPCFTYLATRGCPYACTFCINSVVKHNRKYRTKPIELILNEIEYLISRYGARTISFPDDCFFVSSEFFNSFVEGILKRNLKFEWGGMCLIDTLLREKELILKAKKAGLIWTGGSGESGSNRLIKMLNKHFTVEEIIESAHFLANNDLMTQSCFMTLLPTETPKETKATLDLMEYLRGIFKKKNNPSYIMGPSIYKPFPGSKLYNMCIETGFKQPETLEDWDRLISPSGHFYLDNITWLG